MIRSAQSNSCGAPVWRQSADHASKLPVAGADQSAHPRADDHSRPQRARGTGAQARIASEMARSGSCDHDRRARQSDRDGAGRSRARPSVMLFAHMDQLGFVVRKIEANGLLRLERLGGVPERALASQEVLICVGEGRDVPARHRQQEPSRDPPGGKISGRSLPGDCWSTRASRPPPTCAAAGVDIGSPVVYAPKAVRARRRPDRRDFGRRSRWLRGDRGGRAASRGRTLDRPD